MSRRRAEEQGDGDRMNADHAADQATQPEPPRPLTYQDLAAQDRAVIYAGDRHAELADRDLSARSAELLRQRGEFDPEGNPGHALLAEAQPLAAGEWLEKLAAGEVMARYYRHPADVHHAVVAGATWEQVAAATGTSEAHVRASYREWAEGQHNLHRDYQGRPRLAHLGLDDAGYAAALARSAGPDPDREAGQ